MKINAKTPAPVLPRILCSLTLFVLLIQVSNAIPVGYSFIGKHKSTRFSFQLVDNLILIPVKVNDRLTLRFILDSGTRTPMILNPATVERLNLSRGRSVTFAGRGLKKAVEGYVVNSIKLELPGIVATGISMVVLKEDYLRMRTFPVAVHGVMGYGLFSRFVVDIDYVNFTITLYDPGTYRPDPLLNTLAIEIRDTKPFIQCPLSLSEGKNIEANLLIDTGAGTGLILEIHSSPLIAAFIKNNKVKKRRELIGRGLGGNLFCYVGKVSRVKVGNYLITDVDAAFTHKDFHPARNLRHGSIGGKILRRFDRIVFNYTNRQIHLKKKYAAGSLVMTSEKRIKAD